MRGRHQPLSSIGSGAEGGDSDLTVSPATAPSTNLNRNSRISSNSSKTEYSPIRGGGNLSNNVSTSLPASPKVIMSTATRTSATPTVRTNSTGGGSGQTRNKGPVATLTTPAPSGGPGRTPTTRRKELSLQQLPGIDNRYTSPTSSPRAANASRVGAASPSSSSTSKKSRRNQDPEPTTPTRKTSTSSSKESGRSSSGSSRKSSSHPNIQNLRVTPQISLDSEGNDRSASKIIRRDKTKFDDLWDSRSIEHGLVRIPTHKLQELISKESIDKFYDVDEKPVASGLFATVRKCTHRESGVMYAAKFSSRVRCGVDCSMEILHEIAMLSACAESNRIVHLKDVFQNKHEIILVLEYAPGGDFQSVLDEDMVPFEEDVQGFLRQILEALEFIHERNIAHLDIKPQNIVLMGQFPNCEIKLCDLEVARVIQEGEDIREIIGTPDYVAPEILTLEPISLAADIWSLGVVAYVLLTGFSPFGGDTDQETLRNITTAELDFPDELFEGVSEEAKGFVAMCLNRDPTQRPTVRECLQHIWLAQEEEPPSPSPLMLKIPTPDPISEPSHYSGGGHSSHSGSNHLGASGGGGGGMGSRRSCQTCRDKITERKRYLSKSREAIFEKVANSNLKKSLSKSRERLCDMRLTLSKSRDHINETKTAAVRSQDKFYGFKCLSKSQEVLSSSLGGAMKRMVNGAVSDITQAFLGDPMMSGSSDRNDVDIVFMIPGGSVLLSNPAAVDLLRSSSASLQLLPISESGRSTTSPDKENNNMNSPSSVPTIEPLIEVSEEEEDTNRAAATVTAAGNKGPNKEEKETQNYEKKLQNLSRSASVDNIGRRLLIDEASSSANGQNDNSSSMLGGAAISIGVQVDLCKSASSPSLRRRLADKADLYSDLENLVSNNSIPSRHKKEPRRRGFSHDHTLGEEKQSYAWRQELDKIRSQKPLRVSELIGTFNRREPRTAEDENEAAVKQRRRASLNLQFEPSTAGMSDTEKSEKWLKAQRRKSTSSLLSNNIENLKIQEQITDILNAQKFDVNANQEEEKGDVEKSVPEKEEAMETMAKREKSPELASGVPKGSYLEKVAQRKKNWEYFEINHPKAISDQRLQQLKAKYQKRRTEELMTENIISQNIEEIEEEVAAEKAEAADTVEITTKPPAVQLPLASTRGTQRSQSVPLFSIEPHSPKSKVTAPSGGNLDLSVDPLTGLCLAARTNEAGRKDVTSLSSGTVEEVTMRKHSSDSDSSGSRRSSRSSRRRSSHLADIAEQSVIPEEKILEVRIDPLTSQVEALEVARSFSPKKFREVVLKDSEKRRRLSVEIISPGTFRNHLDDDGFGSLPHTPTELTVSPPGLNSCSNSTSSSIIASKSSRLDDGIFTSSEEVLDDHQMHSPPNQQQQQQQQQQQNKSSASLDGDGDNRSTLLAWGDEIRPASALANPISRMCTGAFSRALVRLSGDNVGGGSSSSSGGSTGSSVDSDLVRRQSSPVFRLSTN